MGLSKKKTKTTANESATVAPSAYAQPFITDAANAQRPGYDESMKVAAAFQPGLMGAANYYGDVQSGKYLDSNPYLDQVVADSNADITDQVNQAFMPRFGSGYHAKALAKQLGANEAALRYGNYATERGYQNDAGRNLAGIATTATALPLLPGESYAGSIGGLLGRYATSNGTSNSTTTQSGGLGSILGGLLQAGSMFLPAGGLGSLVGGGAASSVLKSGINK